MKYVLFSILSALLLGLTSTAQECNMTSEYEEFIIVRKNTYGERSYIYKSVVETDEDNCYAPLINTNVRFANYLLTNFSSYQNHEELTNFEDSMEMKERYFSDLSNDSLFNATMSEWVSKTIDPTKAKDTISMDQLLNVAVKYFSILRITGEGYYAGKVCAGLNDIRSTLPTRQPFVEAFCFSSIFQDIVEPKYNIQSEFIEAIKELYTLSLGVDREEQLYRAQGAIYILMKNNAALQELLVAEYEKKKEFLPFVLKG